MTPPAVPPASFLDEDKSLACVHCGLCLGACPTYLETGNENESPRGRIYLMRALQSGRLPVNDASVRHIDLCLGCRACETACPSGVQYGALLESTRQHVETTHRRTPFQTFLRRVAIERIFPFPGRLKLAVLPARLLRFAGGDRWLPRFLRDAVSLIPDRMDGPELPAFSPAAPDVPRRGRVGFVSGCVMSVFFHHTNLASIKLLNRAGYDVVTPHGQGCCGALHAHSGRLETARQMARRNIAQFEAEDCTAIVINAAGCGSTLKEYGHLLAEDDAWAGRAQRLQEKVRDLVEILASPDATFTTSLAGRSPTAARVTYHDACHLAHPQRITRQPRDLIRAVAGAQFVEMPESDLCCGSAGTYNLTEPEMAARLQQRKAGNVLQSGAEVIVTTNPGCLLQIRAGLKQAGASHIRVLHLADYLWQALDPAT